MNAIAENCTMSASEAHAQIRHLASLRGIDLVSANIQQVMIENPDMNVLRLHADEVTYGYRRTTDKNRHILTKEQRHSWAACGPYQGLNKQKNQIRSTRHLWLSWLFKRANNSLALTKRQRDLIAAEYHQVTITTWYRADKAVGGS